MRSCCQEQRRQATRQFARSCHDRLSLELVEWNEDVSSAHLDLDLALDLDLDLDARSVGKAAPGQCARSCGMQRPAQLWAHRKPRKTQMPVLTSTPSLRGRELGSM